MTQDEFIEMARQANFEIENGMFDLKLVCVDGVNITKDLEAFAKLVAEKEREACAKVADEYANGLERNYSEIIADIIRARGNT